VSPERVSTREHWESYWRGNAQVEDTYSTGGRLAREVRHEGPVAGRRMMEVGAGSGRDLLELAREEEAFVVGQGEPGQAGDLAHGLGRHSRHAR